MQRTGIVEHPIQAFNWLVHGEGRCYAAIKKKLNWRQTWPTHYNPPWIHTNPSPQNFRSNLSLPSPEYIPVLDLYLLKKDLLLAVKNSLLYFCMYRHKQTQAIMKRDFSPNNEAFSLRRPTSKIAQSNNHLWNGSWLHPIRDARG